MRADRPIPGNPWPHDMVLHIQDDEDDLLELLWVRERFGLEPVGDDVPRELLALPELPPTAESLRRDKHAWNRAWTELWAAALGRWDHAPRRPIDTTGLDDEQVRALLTGPRWRTRFGDAPFDDGYDAWLDGLQRRRATRRLLGWDEQPEQRSLPALIAAWRRGLTTIVTLPCHGDYARTIGAETLLVTEESRDDPARFDRALAAFDPRG